MVGLLNNQNLIKRFVFPPRKMLFLALYIVYTVKFYYALRQLIRCNNSSSSSSSSYDTYHIYVSPPAGSLSIPWNPSLGYLLLRGQLR